MGEVEEHSFPPPIIFFETPESSRTSLIGFDEFEKAIHIIFPNGREYKYEECERWEWLLFLHSPSKGQFVSQFLNSKPYYEV